MLLTGCCLSTLINVHLSHLEYDGEILKIYGTLLRFAKTLKSVVKRDLNQVWGV